MKLKKSKTQRSIKLGLLEISEIREEHYDNQSEDKNWLKLLSDIATVVLKLLSFVPFLNKIH